MESLIQNIKYGLRSLAKSPGFTLVAIVTLALGIGANTAIFSVVNAVLLQPLSYPQPERLVQLQLKGEEGTSGALSIPNYNVMSAQTQAFEAVAVFDSSGPGINLTGADRPEQLKGIHVSSGYFQVFGAPVALGRVFTAEEDRPGGPSVAVISNGLWRSRFGSDPGMIGRTLELGGDPYTVIGVLGASYQSDPQADVWLPVRPDPNSINQGHYLLGAARMRPGVTLAQANAAMDAAANDFRQRFPGNAVMGPKDGFRAQPLRDVIVGDARKGLLLLFGAVGFVLLIACANVANLLLARANIRKREIAIRSALGAGRGRLIGQLLTESVLLSIAGGVLGLLFGFLGVRWLLSINPGDIPRIGENGAGVGLDWRVLAFTLAAAVITGILFGLVPALSSSRADISVTLRESGSRTGSGVRHNKMRSILVVTEMALALVLLVGAALLIRTFAALRGVDPGFNAKNVLTMDMSLNGKRFEKAVNVEILERDGRRRLEALPGVDSAALTCCLPFEGGFGLPFNIVGQAPKDGPYTGSAGWLDASADYFKVFKIPVQKGRVLDDRDSNGAALVAVINQTMEKKFWPKGDAVGSQIIIGKGVGPEFEEGPREVIGVVADVHESGLDQDPDPMMYVPVTQVTDGSTALTNRIGAMQWVIRTNVPPFSLSGDIQRELRDATGGLPVAHLRSMEQVVKKSTASNDFYMTLLTIFAGVALALAAIGIYGLMAYSVQQRTPEIGLRMALGASPTQVRRMVVLQGMLLALIGVVIGVAAALALARLMASLLFGVKPWDPAAIIIVAVVLSAVTFLATYLPARRASRVEPMIALRYE
ncbi:MAG TPA: ABC transporter permease [Candidatus Acidoferrales bacterium]